MKQKERKKEGKKERKKERDIGGKKLYKTKTISVQVIRVFWRPKRAFGKVMRRQ